MNRKLRFGMIGGGRGAFIGAVHRLAAQMDGAAELVAGAFSADPERSLASGRDWGLAPERVYESYVAMAAAEAAQPPERRLDFVVIVTPNHQHFAPARLFLERGFNVVCDKPVTLSLDEAFALKAAAAAAGKVFVLTHNYTGNVMVKQARALVRAGHLGRIRKVLVEYSQGWLATALETSGNKQAAWRTDPQRSGLAGCLGDIGTHAENLARYITGLHLESLCADLTTFVPGRQLDDDGSILLRFVGGAKGLLHASQVCIGDENALGIRVYGDQAALEWYQERPEELIVKYPDRPRESWRRQLICTTQKSVITNVTKSLTESGKNNQESKYVLVATSQALTPKQKRNLEAKVKTFGKTLLPVFDQEPVAQRLHRDPKWLKELLGITGTPPALSRVPINLRPTFDLDLVGRDDEANAVISAAHDLVLVGQPGSGKTSLLVALSEKIGALFLVSQDPTAIADAIRSMQPKRIIVDDAASRVETLDLLCQWRRETGADFRIVATCWPSQRQIVAAHLGVANEPAVELDPLPQKTIKEIVSAMKILGPDEIVQEILHQAAGKPGLAVTLCQVCLRGGAHRLFTGEALAGDIRMSLEAAGAEHAVGILGCFSFGGDAGMSIDSVAALSGLSAVRLRDMAETMSAAGVLQDVPDDRLAVSPARLRQALVRDVFFRNAPLDWRAAVPRVPSLEAMLGTVIAAALLGGVVPDEELRVLLEKIPSSSRQLADLYGQYARLGADQARWVLSTRPECARQNGAYLLEVIPAEVLPVLLRAELNRNGVFVREIDLKPLANWIYEAGSSDESLPRRELLLKALEANATELKGTSVMLAAVRLVIGLGFEWTRPVPGDPYQFTITTGLVTEPLIEVIAALWPRVLPLLRDFHAPEAFQLFTVVNDWTHPGRRGRGASTVFENASRVHARKMLADLLDAYRTQWTVVNLFATVAEILGRPLAIDTTTLAGRLFPPRQLNSDFDSTETEIAALAAEWDGRGPKPEFVREWVMIDREAHAANVAYPNLSRGAAHVLAAHTREPQRWFDELVAANAPSYLVEPFASRCCTESEAFRRAFISKNLGAAPLSPMAIEQLVLSIAPQDQLWSSATAALVRDLEQIKWMVRREQVPVDTLEALLTQHGPAVAAAVAAELWYFVADGKLPQALRSSWEHAVVESLEDDHVLAVIGVARPDLAFHWLSRRVNRTAEQRRTLGGLTSYRVEAALTSALSREQRLGLIEAFGADSGQSHLLRCLIGSDLDLFRRALARPETRKAAGEHLGLPGDPVTPWAERAVSLLDAGFTENDVMWASDLIGGSWTGPVSRHFEEKRVHFSRLLHHPEPRIRRIGEAAVSFLIAERDRAQTEERRAAVHGEIV